MNPNASRSSDPLDPLAGYEGIGLFPRTLEFQPNDPLPSHPDDLDSVRNRLKSIALRSPSKLLQQAKTIIDGSSELMNSEVPSDLVSQGDIYVVDTNDNEIHRDRRPGLGRKRARFSMKPNSSQPSVSLEPNLDINQLKDPVEFFMAYERHENAKREMQKQMGGTFIDSDQQNPSTKPRQRRPGILGANRRHAKYKHFHFSVHSDDNEPPVSSQETFEEDILSPTQSMNQTKPDGNIASQSQEVHGSISKTENRTDGFFDELLSTSCDYLDDDGAVARLQEHLQIKPIVLEKLSLPDLQNIRRSDLKALVGKSPKPRKVLADMQNLFGGASYKVSLKCREKTDFQSKGSPTPPKSPSASVLAFKKRMMHQSDCTGDQFSFSLVDTSPARNASPVDHSAEQPDPDGTLEHPSSSDEFKSSRIEEDDNTVPERSSPRVTTGDSPDRNEKSGDEVQLCSSSELKSLRIEKDDNTAAEACYPEVMTGDSPDRNGKSRNEVHLCSSSELKSLRIEEDDNTVAEPCSPKVTTGDSPHQNGKYGDNDSNRVTFANYFGPTSHVDLEDHIGGSGINERVMNEDLSTHDADVEFQKEVSAFQDNTMQVGDVPEAGAPAVEEPNNTAHHLDQSSPAAAEDHTIGGPHESVDIGVEQQHEQKNQEPSSTSKNEQSKSKLHQGKGRQRKHSSQAQNLDGADMPCDQDIPEASRGSVDEQTKSKSSPRQERKRKDRSRRQSLAGAGTKWADGVRRSTRFKTRPLEYWKGERFLYGRIHNTMSTVIGLKSFSPAKGERDPAIKVKQFVSDEYKELVELAASH